MKCAESKPLLEDIVMAELEIGMDIDDVFTSEPLDHGIVIADLLKWSYAIHLHLVISSVAKKYCNGCHYDHPSQLEHNVCVTMPFEEQVDKWFDEALQTVDEDCIIGHWFGTLGLIHPTV